MRAAPLQAATDRAVCVAAPQQHQPLPPATRRSPQGLRPGTGKGASAGAGPLRRATRPAAGRARAAPPPPPAPPPQPHTTRPPFWVRPNERNQGNRRTLC